MVHTLLKETACPWRNLRRIYSWWVLLTALVTENKAEVQAETLRRDQQLLRWRILR